MLRLAIVTKDSYRKVFCLAEKILLGPGNTKLACCRGSNGVRWFPRRRSVSGEAKLLSHRELLSWKCQSGWFGTKYAPADQCRHNKNYADIL